MGGGGWVVWWNLPDQIPNSRGALRTTFFSKRLFLLLCAANIGLFSLVPSTIVQRACGLSRFYQQQPEDNFSPSKTLQCCLDWAYWLLFHKGCLFLLAPNCSSETLVQCCPVKIQWELQIKTMGVITNFLASTLKKVRKGVMYTWNVLF